MENKSYFDRNVTDIIKGIALIFMFVHHFFTFPDWYVESISYPELSHFAQYFCAPFKICVPVFAFLTGYFYDYTKTKSLNDSIKKITDILITYWFVYIPFLTIAGCMGVYSGNFKDIFLEFFALKRPVMVFCWYVYFYCISMILLWMIAPLLSKNKMRGIFLGIVLPVGVYISWASD